MKRMITCIVCPMGCTMAVEMNGEEITVTGNACPRGEKRTCLSARFLAVIVMLLAWSLIRSKSLMVCSSLDTSRESS